MAGGNGAAQRITASCTSCVSLRARRRKKRLADQFAKPYIWRIFMTAITAQYSATTSNTSANNDSGNGSVSYAASSSGVSTDPADLLVGPSSNDDIGESPRNLLENILPGAVGGDVNIQGLVSDSQLTGSDKTNTKSNTKSDAKTEDEGGQGSKTGKASDKWMDIAKGQLGISEAKAKDQDNIRNYHNTTSAKGAGSGTPWCSSFVNAVMEKAGYKGTDSAAAASWKTWGKHVDLKNAREGDIVVFDKDKNNGFANHVGFIKSIDLKSGKIEVIGGNQGPDGQGKVSVSTYYIKDWPGLEIRRPDKSDRI
jgi:uncharacterized protein (TIGR02594 family)